MTAIQAVTSKAKEIGVILDKPDRKIWKWIGNIMIYGILPAAQLAALIVPDPYKSILREAVPIIAVAIKGLTKFTTEQKAQNK